MAQVPIWKPFDWRKNQTRVAWNCSKRTDSAIFGVMGTKHMHFLRRYLLDTNYTGYTYHQMYHIHIYTWLIDHIIYIYMIILCRCFVSHQVIKTHQNRAWRLSADFAQYLQVFWMVKLLWRACKLFGLQSLRFGSSKKHPDKIPRWSFQPIWKVSISQIGSFPQGSGWK